MGVSTQSTWGLDQPQLLRSQHKMARLLLVAALCLASVKAAVIPVEEIVDNLQSFLTAPEESGLRLKRSTGEWDKEFDLSSMGILFQLKYNNPANPFEGGRAHVKVPGARFIRNAPFDDMDLDIEFNGGSAIDGLFDMKVNNGQKFELMTKDTFIVTKQSPFHWMNTMVTGGREWTKMEHTRNIFFDKVNKAQMINKMKIEEHNILDGQTWYHIKYDNTAPKIAFLFTYLPYNMDQAWTYEGGREHTANGGFTLTHKITHGENVIQEAEWVFDVKANDGSKFEMEHLHKMTMTEESPLYGMVYWYTGRYGKNVERKMTVFFDKINKSILFVPKMKMDTTLTLDGKKISEFVFDNTQAKKHIKFFYSPDAYTKDYLFTDEWEYPGHSGCKWNTELKRGDVSIWNWVGDYSFVNNANKFEIKTMDKIVQTEMSPFYGLDHFYLGRY